MSDGKIIIDTSIDSSGVEEGLKGIAKSGLKAITAASTALATMGAFAIKTGVDFESAFTGVKKTVDASEQQLAQLEAAVRSMSKVMPQSAVEIAGVAEAAGQLGIKIENIESFTKSMVMLGDSTNMSSEEAATSLARLANITQMPQTEFDKLGSVIVHLGNNLATTESEVVAMALRLAGAGKQIGLTEAQTLGLAGAFSSVGIEAEMGGSAISKVMVKMQAAATIGSEKAKKLTKVTGMSIRELELLASNNSMAFKELADSIGMTTSEINSIVKSANELEDFGKIAGMTGDEFKKAFEEDASTALIAFIRGLGNAESAGTSAIEMLEEMGIKEVRLRDSLLRAANAGSLLEDSINMGTKAWEENTALTKEAETRYATMESQLKILKNGLTDLGISFYKEVNSPMAEIVKTANSMVEELSNAFSKGGFEGFVSQLGDTLATIIAQISSNAPKMIDLGVSLVKNLTTGIQNNLPAIATGAIGIVMSLVNGIVEMLPTLLEVGLQAIIALGQGIAENLPSLIPAIVNLIISMCDMIIENLPLILDVAIQIIMALVQGLITALPTLISEVPRIINSFANAIYSALPQVLEAGVQILMMLIKGLIDSIPTLIANIPQIILAIVNAITLYNWTSLGKNLIEWIGNGLSSMKGSIGSVAKGIADSVVNGIKNIFTSGTILGRNLISWVSNGISGSVGTIVNTARSMATGAINAIKNVFSWSSLSDIGKNLVKGIWNGISNMTGWIIDLIGGFAGSVIKSIKNFFDIHSPSRVMRDLIGVNLVKGIGVGIDVETPKLEKDIDANMADLVAKMQATVDYEIAMTTARVVAHNNSMQSDPDNNITATESNVTIKVPVILEGKEVAEATAPYSDKINGRRLNLAKRGLSLG